MPADEIVVVGRIGSPYGIKGWVHVQSFTSPAENLLAYEPWLVQTGTGGDWRELHVRQCKAHKKNFVAWFEHVDDRDTAGELAGSMLGVRRGVMPAPAETDEFYWRDLIGCGVETQTGENLGVVSSLLETGAHDVLVVEAPGDGEDVLIPFTKEYVVTVNVDASLLTVAWDSDW